MNRYLLSSPGRVGGRRSRRSTLTSAGTFSGCVQPARAFGGQVIADMPVTVGDRCEPMPRACRGHGRRDDGARSLSAMVTSLTRGRGQSAVILPLLARAAGPRSCRVRGSNPASCCLAVRGRSGEGPVTCGSFRRPCPLVPGADQGFRVPCVPGADQATTITGWLRFPRAPASAAPRVLCDPGRDRSTVPGWPFSRGGLGGWPLVGPWRPLGPG
jgi:hypothetical protein